MSTVAIGGKKFAGDVPWRAAHAVEMARLSYLPPRRLRRTPLVDYAFSQLLLHPDPASNGLAGRAFVESGGRDCILPGHVRAYRFLGFQVWPVDFGRITRPVAKEAKTIGRIMDSAFELMEIGAGNRY